VPVSRVPAGDPPRPASAARASTSAAAASVPAWLAERDHNLGLHALAAMQRNATDAAIRRAVPDGGELQQVPGVQSALHPHLGPGAEHDQGPIYLPPCADRVFH
jgi:hypothetical protein